jgi:hypothetical protein
MEINFKPVELESNINLEGLPEFELPTGGIAKDVILDVLISKQYQNPLNSSIREAFQNAFDANIESGNENLGVQITLPCWTDPTFSIRDFGRGIDRERFDKVYRRIGESTKRSDNTQSGGFGIGRLSALAVSDQVAITSVVDGVKYTHVLLKRGDGKYSFVTVDESPTEELNGTTVSYSVAEYLKGSNYAGKVKGIEEFIKELTWWSKQPVWVKKYIQADGGEGEGQETFSLLNSKKDQNKEIFVDRGNFFFPDGTAFEWEYNSDDLFDSVDFYFIVGNLAYWVNPEDFRPTRRGGSYLTLKSEYAFFLSHRGRFDHSAYLNTTRKPYYGDVTEGRKLAIYTKPGVLKLTSNRERFLDDEESRSLQRKLLDYASEEFLLKAKAKLENSKSLKEAIQNFSVFYPVESETEGSATYKGHKLSHSCLSFRFNSEEEKNWVIFKPLSSLSPEDLREVDRDLQVLEHSGLKTKEDCKDSTCHTFKGGEGRGRIYKQIPLYYFLKFTWVVCKKGVRLDKIRQNPRVPKDKVLLVIQLPLEGCTTLAEQVSKHSLLKLAEPHELVVLEPEKKKPSAKKVREIDPAIEIKQLTKQGRVRKLVQGWERSRKRSIYEMTQPCYTDQTGGVYALTTTEMNNFCADFVPPNLAVQDINFVPDSVTRILRNDPNWISLQDYSCKYFNELITRYEDALALLDYRIDLNWLSDDAKLSNHQAAEGLAQILREAVRIHPDFPALYSLIELLCSHQEFRWLSKISSLEGNSYINEESSGSLERVEHIKKVRVRINNQKGWSGWGLDSEWYVSDLIPVFSALYKEYPMLLYSLGQYKLCDRSRHLSLPKFKEFRYSYNDEKGLSIWGSHDKILDVLIDYIKLINSQSA